MAQKSAGWLLQHQRLQIEADFGRRGIRGRTELHLAPTSAELREIRLNARQLRIHACRLNGRPVTFELEDHLNGSHAVLMT
jgi:aminopeptidase N